MKTNPIEKWTGHVGSDIFKAFRDIGEKGGAGKAVIYILHFVLGIALSNAVIFGRYAPFGLGYVAAAGAGVAGLFSMLGVIIGYAVMWRMEDGLKYIAVALLIFAAGFIFRDTSIYKKTWFMPAVTAFMTACVGIVFVIEAGLGVSVITLYITEILVALGAAYFYSTAISGRISVTHDEKELSEIRRIVSVLVLICTALIALSRIVVIADMSVGRIIAVIIILLASYRGGLGIGSAAGVSIGISMDVALGGNAFFSMAYAFSGMLAGVFSRRGKLLCAVMYVIANAAAVLWMPDGMTRITVLYEAFAGSVIFMLIPDNAFPGLNAAVKADTGTVTTNPERIREYVSQKLSECSNAFRDLHSTLTNVFLSLNKINDNDVAVIFDRTSNRICRKCALTNVCWEREYVDTFNSLNDAAPVMLKKGRADTNDFPAHFVSRCMNFGAFAAALNEEITALMYRKQYKNRLKESRNMITNQYSGLSAILSEIASEIDADLSFDANAERRLLKYIKENGVIGKASVYMDPSGRMHAEITGRDLSKIMLVPDTLSKMGDAIGIRLCEPEYVRTQNEERIRLNEAEPIAAALGMAANKKQGQKISGDSGSYFKDNESRLFMMLSDGMGSGRAAAMESGMAVRLLERFLRAGIQPETALKTLNSALVLKGEEDGSFVTMDLLALDLFTGAAELYKYGAAPSYIKRGGRVSRITGRALPVGVGIESAPALDVTRLQLSDGDFIIMASDGVSDANDDNWLLKEAAGFGGDEPRELAELLLKKAKSMYGNNDDMTVMALKVEARGK